VKAVVALGALLVLIAGRLPAQGIAYEGGLSVSTGTYFFTERTTSYVLTNGLALRAGPFTFRAWLPAWLRNTSLVTTTGAGPIPDGGSSGRDAVRDSGAARKGRDGGSGGGPGGAMLLSAADPAVPAPAQSLTGWEFALADPTVQAGMRLLDGPRTSLSVAVSAKLPLADTSTIGTGEWDVGASVSLSRALSRRLTAGLDASYWHLGDLPDFDFRDPVMGSASLGMLLGSRWGALASLSAGTSAIEGYDPPAWIGAAISRFTNRGAMGFNLSVGLTETVPDVSAGLSWSLPLRHATR